MAPSPVPYRTGGAEQLWDGLLESCRAMGHPAELLKLPCREYSLSELLSSYCQFAEIDLSHFDVVITGKYPAWAVNHPQHVLWMLHPLRGLYDRYPRHLPTRVPGSLDPSLAAALRLAERLETHTGSLHEPLLAIRDHVLAAQRRLGSNHRELDIPSPLARALTRAIDHACMSHSRVRTFAAISREVAGRPAWFPKDAEVRVVLPPLPPTSAQHPNVAGPPSAAISQPRPDISERPARFFAVGRLEAPKRFDLAIRALQLLAKRHGTPAELRIAGTGSQAELLQELASVPQDDGAQPSARVSFLGHIDNATLDEEYRSASAVIFTPDREDFGYVALESMARSVPVITATDSGGPLELIESGVTGWVVPPDPSAVADAMFEAISMPETTRRMGEAANAQAAAINWPEAIDALLSEASAPEAEPAILALSTYPVFPRAQGGQIRAWHLLRGLAERGHRVEIVSLTVDAAAAGRRALSESLTETTILLSETHTDAETQIRLVSGPTAITDVASSLLWSATPDLARHALGTLEHARCAILVQPYLSTALHRLLGQEQLPIVLDAHNVEIDLKAEMFADNDGGRWLLDKVAVAETEAVRDADTIVTTTPLDAARFSERYAVSEDRLRVIPNGADVHAVDFVVGEDRKRIRRECLASLDDRHEHLVIFVGSGHQPNVDAALLLAEVARQMPEVAVALLGRHSEMLSRRALPPNVYPLGIVSADTLTAFQAGATAAANPIRLGGGSNLKLTEYFAAGAPVITTAIGARGIDDPSELAWICEPDPGALAAGIRSIIADPPSAEERARRARRFAEETLDWRRLGARFADAVEATMRR